MTAKNIISNNLKTENRWWKYRGWKYRGIWGHFKTFYPYLLSTLAFIFSVWTYYKNTELQGFRQESEYLVNALEKQTRLEVVSWPTIDSAWTEVPNKTKSLVREALLTGKALKDIPSLIHVKSSMVVKNTSPYPAFLLGIGCVDSMDMTPILREELMHLLQQDSIGYLERRVITVLPGKTERITETDLLVHSPTPSRDFTLHWLILYENGAGMLYDTYVWTVLHVPNFDIRVEAIQNTSRDKVYIGYWIDSTLTRGNFTRSDSCEDSKVYSLKEKDKIREAWRQRFARLTSNNNHGPASNGE